MVSIATIGPEGSHAWQAARRYKPAADIKVFPHLTAAFEAFERKETDLAVLPAYNTRQGQMKEYLRLMKKIRHGYWVDNVVLPIHLSLGSLTPDDPLTTLSGSSEILRQSEEYIVTNYPDASLVAVPDLEQTVSEIRSRGLRDHGVIDSEEALRRLGLLIRAREISPHNRTRFAVLGREIPPPSGYDATTLVTTPLKDRVGILFDILGEFSNRGINLLDMQTETDPKSQKLQFAIELEGHWEDRQVKEALFRIENLIIQEPGTIKVLGSYPRVDMRVKRIRNFGFIGSGEMSQWFARQLESEGYETVITGRSSSLRPEEMLPGVDVAVICVPISATVGAIRQYGPLLRHDQALILLAGEAENVLNTAMEHTVDGVEIMLVHNLWGPQAVTMKDKNASVVRTIRSGVLCSEFEAFLYKHGARISTDTPSRHDLMMGVSQKLPTAISVAFASALKQNRIPAGEIGSHSTLTSIYSILSMARVHSQNPRTYAEILATRGDSRKIVRDFAENLRKIIEMAEQEKIEDLCTIIEENRGYLTENFLKEKMDQALGVDDALGKKFSRY